MIQSQDMRKRKFSAVAQHGVVTQWVVSGPVWKTHVAIFLGQMITDQTSVFGKVLLVADFKFY